MSRLSGQLHTGYVAATKNLYCRNLIKKPWAYNPQIVGFIEGTLVMAQGFLIRFPHYPKSITNPKP